MGLKIDLWRRGTVSDGENYLGPAEHSRGPLNRSEAKFRLHERQQLGAVKDQLLLSEPRSIFVQSSATPLDEALEWSKLCMRILSLNCCDANRARVGDSLAKSTKYSMRLLPVIGQMTRTT